MTTLPSISQHGLSLTLPPGWDGVIFWRSPAPGEVTRPVLHTASFPLPPERGDFGSGAVELMGPGEVFLALLEYLPGSAGTALFGQRGIPAPLRLLDFSPRSLQRILPPQAGVQRFFVTGGRAFCLYVVLGSFSNGPSLIPMVNQVVGGLTVSALDGSAPA